MMYNWGGRGTGQDIPEKRYSCTKAQSQGAVEYPWNTEVFNQAGIEGVVGYGGKHSTE